MTERLAAARFSSPSISSTGCDPRQGCRDENAESPRFREPRRTCSEPGEVDSRHEGENQPAVTPRAIVLDAVGTLFYADPPVATVYSAVAREFGVSIDPETVRRRFAVAMKRTPIFGFPLDDAIERTRWIERVRYVFAEAAVERFDELFEALWNRFAEPRSWRAYEDVPTALAIAKTAGMRLAVGSNFDSRLIPIVESLFPATFDVVLPATTLCAAKPDPAFFRAVEARLDTPGEEIVLVGDDPRDDGAGATLAGWSFRLVSADPSRRSVEAASSVARLLTELVSGR